MMTVFQFTANLMFHVLVFEPIPFFRGQMATLMFVSSGYNRREFHPQRPSLCVVLSQQERRAGVQFTSVFQQYVVPATIGGIVT